MNSMNYEQGEEVVLFFHLHIVFPNQIDTCGFRNVALNAEGKVIEWGLLQPPEAVHRTKRELMEGNVPEFVAIGSDP
jgi:hypothetical protein